jgi:hypothetical protein
MTTMLFERVWDVLVVLHGAENPSEDEWNAYVRLVHDAQFSTTPMTGVFVTTHGGAPNAIQRRSITEAAGLGEPVICVCTDSVIARGVVTAFSWIYRTPLRAFRLDEVDRALEALKVDPGRRSEVIATLTRLKRQMQLHDG